MLSSEGLEAYCRNNGYIGLYVVCFTACLRHSYNSVETGLGDSEQVEKGLRQLVGCILEKGLFPHTEGEDTVEESGGVLSSLWGWLKPGPKEKEDRQP